MPHCENDFIGNLHFKSRVVHYKTINYKCAVEIPFCDRFWVTNYDTLKQIEVYKKTLDRICAILLCI